MCTFNPEDHLINLKGKSYLQVMWRIRWLRDVHPGWCMNTELVNYDPETKHAIFRAAIFDDNGKQISSGYGSESARDFGDFIEKAETKAIGRALALAGFGTQFTGDELDEGDRIVDSPAKLNITPKEVEPTGIVYRCADCGGIIQATEKNTAKGIAEAGRKKFGKPLCCQCYMKANAEAKESK